MIEQFWNWLVEFNARRFMQGAAVTGLLCLGLAILLLVSALRMDPGLPDSNPSLALHSASSLPEVPRLPEMQYAKGLPSLYTSPYLNQRIAADLAQRRAAQEQPAKTAPIKPEVEPSAPVAPPASIKPEKKNIPLRYAGVMHNTQGLPLALVDDLSKKSTQALKTGATFYGWTVAEITRHQVVLRHGEEDAVCILPKGKIIQLKEQQ